MNIETPFAPLLDLLMKSATLILFGIALLAGLRKVLAANRDAAFAAIIPARVVCGTFASLAYAVMALALCTAQQLHGAAERRPVTATDADGAKPKPQWIITKVDFQDATLRDACEFLAAKSKRLDEKGEGANIVIRNADKIGDVRITLTLNNVPFVQVLRYIAEMANCEVVREEFAFVVGPKQAGKAPVPIAPAAPAAAKPADAVLKMADAIVFPRIDFRDATLAESVKFLTVKSRKLDAEGKGVNIVLKHTDKIGEARITLDLSNVPIAEVLRYVAVLADCELVREESAFVLRPMVIMPDQEGKAHAPIANQENAARGAAVVVEPASAAWKTAGKVIFPKIDFRDATLSEAVDFLREKSKALDPEGNGVNLILNNPAAGGEVPRLTITLTNSPLSEVLCEIAALAGCRIVADGYAITLRPAAK